VCHFHTHLHVIQQDAVHTAGHSRVVVGKRVVCGVLWGKPYMACKPRMHTVKPCQVISGWYKTARKVCMVEQVGHSRSLTAQCHTSNDYTTGGIDTGIC
jgi:hypothetical protein